MRDWQKFSLPADRLCPNTANMHRASTLPGANGRLIVIGDVHGCLSELQSLVRQIDPRPEDRVILVGDLVNRGPDSAGVIDFAIEHRLRSVMGNHELRLLQARKNPKKAELKAYDADTMAQLKKRHWRYIEAMPTTLYYPEWNVIVAHGGFLPGTPWWKQKVDVVSRLQVITAKGKPAKRSDDPQGQPWGQTWKGPELVIYGHTPRPDPEIDAYAIGIDTGCAYGNCLTACILPGRKIVQVPAQARVEYNI